MNLSVALLACAACYGASDAPMTKGMNMAILTLLGVTVLVLGGVGGMIFHLAKRARQHPVDGDTLDQPVGER